MPIRIFKLSLALASALGLSSCSLLSKRGHGYKVQENQVYKSVDGFDLKADLYIPDGKGLKPGVLVVHGGGWDRRSGEMVGISQDLVKSGFVVLNITYRLAPEHLYPKAVEDVQSALDWFKSNADKYELDVKKVSAWGYSAGAHLILLVGLKPENNLVALVAGGTPTNLTVWPNSPIVKKFIGGAYLEKKEIWEQASPVNHVQAASPPVYLYHGEGDKLVEINQMYMMEQAMKKMNRPVETHKVSFWGHAAVYVFSQESIDKGIEFIKKNLQNQNQAMK